MMGTIHPVPTMNLVITLTTDFGPADSYVAQMKGEILRINPDVRLVDVTHEVPAQDVTRAALILNDIVDSFPPDTVHLAVVDPGVGSSRRLVAVEMAGQHFVGPDNGVFGCVAKRHPPTRAVRLDEPRFWRQLPAGVSRSSTFHGRDILAPVAAHISLRVDLGGLGATLDDGLQPTPVPEPVVTPGRITGEVLWIDRFGNLISNIDSALLAPFAPSQRTIEVAGQRIAGLAKFYAEQPSGALLALIGSHGLLEISVCRGSAAERLHARPGDRVSIED
jgi:S-adenosylmethionine hydrolase